MARLKKVQEFVKKEQMDALLIEEPLDLFYLTGLKLSLGKLLVSNLDSILYVDGRYFEAAQKKSPCQVVLLTDFKLSKTAKIGFDSHVTSYKKFLELSLQCDFLIPMQDPIKIMRQIKGKEEIAFLKEANELGAKGYDFVVSRLVEGISEQELALELEIFWKRNGGEKVAFEPIIAFGANSAEPHYRAGASRLKKGDTVLIDIGVMKNGYASDMTRTLFFGNPHPEMEKIYSIVKIAQQAALDKCKSGTPLSELDLAARDVIEKAGYGAYFPHSLGHGVGLDVHELPVIRKNAEGVLEKNMVVTIEPGIYLPQIGGVRLEDTILITEKGFESMTNRCLTPKISL